MTRFGDEDGVEMSRAELAEKLVEIAAQLKGGTVVIGGEEVAVPEHVYLEIEVEDGELELEIKWGDAFEDGGEDEDEEEEEIVYGEADDDEDDEDDDAEDDTDDDEDLFR
jgi:amphi-Trp domain-containing protein